MVQKGKRKQKKTCKRNSKKITIQCGQVFYRFPLRGSDKEMQELLLTELKEELELIYKIYLLEICKRFSSYNFWLSTYKFQQFPIILEEERINILRSKLKKIMKIDQMKVIYYIFYMTIHKFLADIHQELLKFSSSSNELTVMYLAESLNALECSAKELGKITEKIPEHSEIAENCEKITKLAFYDRILKNYEGVLSKLSLYSDSVVLQKMLTLLIELKKVKNLDNFMDEEILRDLREKSIKDFIMFIHGDQQLNKESIEEILEFIDEESDRGSKVRLEIMKILDEELESFKNVLDSSEHSLSKSKPNLSSEFIVGLKSQIEKNKLYY